MNWKSNTLIFLTYNNYYNRIVKKEETLQDYLEYELFRLSATNFNPADGVNTTHIVNMADGLYPDYIIIVDEYNQIVSRWFIIESDRIRGGQYTLTLHRDLMVDYYDNIVNAPCFIEKATLSAEDPLLFNNEDMTFNEIKKEEILLKDYTECPWIIGYYAKDTPAQNLQGTVPLNTLDDIYDIIIETPFENWKYNATTTPIKTRINAIDYHIYAKTVTSDIGIVKVSNTGNYVGWSRQAGVSTPLQIVTDTPQKLVEDYLGPLIADQRNTLYNQALAYISPVLSEDETTEFLNLNGKIVKDITAGKYYKINLYQDALIYETKDVSAGALFNSLSDIIVASPGIVGTPNASTIKIYTSFVNYKMSVEELTGLETTWNMSGSKLITENSPYNIFAIPFGNCKLKELGVLKCTSKEEYALPLAQSIIQKMGKESLYDIQLLPYCPIEDLDTKTVKVKSIEAYSIVKDKDDNPVSFILNLPSSTFSKNLYYNVVKPFTSIDTKVSNECKKYRLSSPNFNGYFDFSIAKNGGLHWFNVDCTLKPYQPYLHINPDFGNLYGRDFNDPRGLICGGDFSLTQYSDAWISYQIQNKNYQEMFDRQIQNMEIQNKYQRQQDIANAIAGTLQGGMSGAATGLMASGGNPYAAAAGAVVGTVASGIGGIMDLDINQALRNEAIDYTKDNFGYQLGNIKALPYTLTKVSSFNENNKIFPVLEVYSCTEREEEAFVNKLAYNGMTVMAIGTINDYIGNKWTYYNRDGKEFTDKGYIKGKIIRLPEINEDFHIANEIAKEINLGIYIGGQE